VNTDRTGQIRSFVLRAIGDHPKDIIRLTTEQFGISRQYVARILRRLVTEGLVTATGRTRDRTYGLRPLVEKVLSYELKPDLAEDQVWREGVVPLLPELPRNVYDICQYGFTEILNNAIHHSGGTRVECAVHVTAISIGLWVIDDGVGIFKKVKNEAGLEDERHAILELSKGKLTTDPQHHTGEGIFFTSRIFDRFAIRSGELSLHHQEPGGDWLIDVPGDAPPGTAIKMEVSRDSTRTIKEVFELYASSEDDFSFCKTRVPVQLLRYGEENLISRSQARRLLARFDRFREILLDFAGVNMIGQAFADEIFRVFCSEYPQIRLYYINTNEDVVRMIRRAIATLTASELPDTPA